MLLGNASNQKWKICTKNRNACCTFCNFSSDEIIIKSYKSFLVLIDRYPLMEGHLLLVSKEHLPSFLDLPKSKYSEFYSVHNEIRNLMLKLYGQCSFYEHGRNPHIIFNNDISPCFHAHMHILPINLDIFHLMGVQRTSKTKDILFQAKAIPGREYLLQLHDSLHWEICHPNEELTRNCIRGFIASALGKEDRRVWNEISERKEIENDFRRTFLEFQK